MFSEHLKYLFRTLRFTEYSLEAPVHIINSELSCVANKVFLVWPLPMYPAHIPHFPNSLHYRLGSIRLYVVPELLSVPSYVVSFVLCYLLYYSCYSLFVEYPFHLPSLYFLSFFHKGIHLENCSFSKTEAIFTSLSQCKQT